jgi:hypothetical protein
VRSRISFGASRDLLGRGPLPPLVLRQCGSAATMKIL